ncbi:MAG TPA: flagellin [bacterium]|nr:flagellin [bacterium]
MAIVNTNFNYFFGLKQLLNVSGQLSSSIEKLTTGYKVNTAAQNPSGKAIAAMYSAQIGGTRMASLNAQDASSLVQSAYSSLDKIHEVLLRMRELSLRAMNDAALTNADRQTLNSEFVSLRNEITYIASRTMFNNKYMLSGDFAGGKNAYISPYAGASKMTIVIPTMTANKIAGGNAYLMSANATLSSMGKASFALAQVDVSIEYLSSVQLSLGVQSQRINYAINDLSAMEVNMSAAKSNITDADMASEVAMFAKLQILSQMGASVLAHGNDLQARIVGLLDYFTPS